MLINDFKRRCEFLYRMTRDFAAAVPEDKWHFTPLRPGAAGGAAIADRHGEGFAPFCKQLRHVVCVRGVYNDALKTKRADFSRKHDHYKGMLDREPLLVALSQKHADLMAALDAPGATESPIDFFGRPFTFNDFAYTVIQHEAIHHGQWSIYASLAGFETPPGWRSEWGL
jgi:hypothetical protein